MKKLILSLLTFILASGSVSFAFASTSASANLQVQTGANANRGGIKNTLDLQGSASTSNSVGTKHPLLNATLNASTTVSANAKAKADTAITNRVTALTKLQTRVDAMVHISASQKSSLDTSIQAAITEMNNLKAKIDADTDPTILKTDIASITASYRIYILVIPQVAIAAAADRAETIAAMMTTISAKFQTRISAAAATGKDVTALNAALSDYNSKIGDANSQATVALSSTVSLSPDNGNQTIRTANHSALVGARGDIKTSTSDLKAARSDAQTIINGLKAFGNIGVSASSSAQ